MKKVLTVCAVAITVSAIVLCFFYFLGCYPQESSEEKKVTEGEVLTLVGTLGMQSTNPKDVKLGSLIYLLGQMKHEREVAREGATKVYVENCPQPNRVIPENVIYTDRQYRPAPGYEWVKPSEPDDYRVTKSAGVPFSQRPDYELLPTGILIYNDWVDDGDNRFELPELIGLEKSVFNLRKEEFCVMFNHPNYVGEILFRTWDVKNGRIIGESIADKEGRGPVMKWSSPNYHMDYPDFAFVVNLASSGPGEYKITAELVTGDVYTCEITLAQ